MTTPKRINSEIPYGAIKNEVL